MSQFVQNSVANQTKYKYTKEWNFFKLWKKFQLGDEEEQLDLWRFQSLRWHSTLQYRTRWHRLHRYISSADFSHLMQAEVETDEWCGSSKKSKRTSLKEIAPVELFLSLRKLNIESSYMMKLPQFPAKSHSSSFINFKPSNKNYLLRLSRMLRH